MAVDVRKDILWRIYLVYLFIFLLAGLIVVRVVKIQVSEGDFWKKRANELTLHYANIEAVRGSIFDINGQLLATSLPYYEVAADLNTDAITDEIFDSNVDSLSYCLSNLFADRTKAQYQRELINAKVSGDRYHTLYNNASYKQLQKLKTFPLFRKGRNKGGLIYTQKGKRELPFKFLASRTIGYCKEGTKVGLEGSYDQQLTGVGGKRLVRRIAGGVEMPVNGENEIEPQDGCDIVSTIDINIQDVAENALCEQLKKHQAGWGCVVLMEVKTGEIRAIANLSRIDTATYGETFNYAIGQSTEPGSTFKLVSLMAAMEDGYIDLNDTVNTGNGKWKFLTQEVKDSHEGGFGKISVKQVFEKSSNVGTAKLISAYYGKNPQAFIDRLCKMGINLSPQLDIAGTGNADIKSTKDKRWSKVSLPWMSFGYELRLTPLQILTFYNAVANDGEMMKPRFVREVRRQGKALKAFEPEVIHPRVASDAVIRQAREMMEGVVLEGTATNLKNADYKIAGKTGTAQIAKNGTYENKKGSWNVTYQASFVGYFPADNPKYSCIVVVNAPSQGVYYGNAVAGPIFKEIADKVYSSLLDIHSEIKDIQAVSPKIPSIKNGSRKDIQTICADLGIAANTNSSYAEYINVIPQADSSIAVVGNTINHALSNRIMPNVLGMGLKDALYLLENAGIRVKVFGKGTIKKQSIGSGTKFSRGTELILDLS
ncbi:MAG: PASTA domain-containing protein [Bacteroidetes bacterium]|nr:MAG: PASTA domain-containing protein [Bacteroidota bacterium]